MTKTIEALFDGVVLRPVEPLPFEPNTRVLVTIESTLPSRDGASSTSFLDVALSLNLRGPSDWSENLDEYLYHGKAFPDDE